MADIGACSPVVGSARGALGVLRLADGARVLVARRACSMAVLFPSFWTVIQHGCWVRLLIGSLTLRGWGSSPLLSAEAHARVGRFVRFRLCPSFCRSKNAREDSYLFLVSAMFGRLSASSGWARPCWGVFVVVPFRLWLGRD